MILINLIRHKGRTLLTIFGISIGVAAIIGLGALGDRDGLNRREAQQARGIPIILGSSAAGALDKSPDDTIQLSGNVFGGSP